jgi:hypothetical protein
VAVALVLLFGSGGSVFRRRAGKGLSAICARPAWIRLAELDKSGAIAESVSEFIPLSALEHEQKAAKVEKSGKTNQNVGCNAQHEQTNTFVSVPTVRRSSRTSLNKFVRL